MIFGMQELKKKTSKNYKKIKQKTTKENKPHKIKM